MLVEFRDRGFVKSAIMITHDLAVLYQIADTILVMYAGKLAEKAPAETIVRRAAPSVHEAPALVTPGGGVTLRGEEAARDPRRPPSLLTRRPAAASATAARSPPRSASRSRRSSRSRLATSRLLEGACDAELDRVSKAYKTGTFGGGAPGGRST